MLNHYKVLTVTHKQVNLNRLGDYAIHADDKVSLQVRLDELKEQFHIEELMYTATCNRVLYFLYTPQDYDEVQVMDFFKHINPLLSDDHLDQLPTSVLSLSGSDALEHVLEVAASIDSLVIGERQILGQLRNAFEQCREWGFIGDNLRLAMNYAVVTAKDIYSNTRIGDKPVSIVSLAIQQLLRANLPKESRILMIGAGQTNELVAKFLQKHEYTQVHVFNRTLAKANSVAEIVSGTAAQLSELKNYQEGFDCIVVCTGASDPILTPELYQHLLQGEQGKKIIIDLAIPHNTHPDVLKQFDVEYIEIEGLRVLAKENMAFREQEVGKARHILEEKLDGYTTHFSQRQLEIAMRQVPSEIKAIKAKAINEVFRKEIDTLDDSTRDLVEKMMSYMEKKCIGIPMKAAREAIF